MRNERELLLGSAAAKGAQAQHGPPSASGAGAGAVMQASSATTPPGWRHPVPLLGTLSRATVGAIPTAPQDLLASAQKAFSAGMGDWDLQPLETIDPQVRVRARMCV
jgi:hypothetical protein